MSVYTKNKYNDDAKNEAWYKIVNLVPENASILDIGCSSGNLGATLKKDKNATVVGIDLDKGDVELAKEKLSKATVVNIEKEDFSGLGTFDVVIMADVIEHLVDPVSVLKKVKKNLKKGGIFIFSVPNMANSTIRIKLLSGKFEYKNWGLLDKTHIHFYDREELERVFIESGYEVTKTDDTVREIPKEILKKELKKIGLNSSDEFHKHMTGPDSITYQFIGVAKLSNKKRKLKLETTSSLDSVSEEIDRIISFKDKEIQRHIEIINRLEGEKENLTQEMNNLKTHINSIESSKAWKVVKQVRNSKKKLGI